MRHHRTFGLLAATLAISLFACSEPTTAPSAPVVPTPGPAFPTVGDTAQAYDRVSPSSWEGASRYVLYRNGNFSLQYATLGFFEYKGRYARTDSVVVFDWDGWSSAGPWGAEGVIAGDSLTVKYNDVMVWTDFEDGVYVRRSAP